jgi:hypothetical protein
LKNARRLLILAGILLLLRAALPYAVKYYAVKTLNKIPGFSARIADIDLSLWRGAYQIEGLEIWKTGGGAPVPFFSASVIDLSIQWKELFHGALVGKINLVEPRLNFVAAKQEQNSQTEMDSSWTDRVQELFPLDINYFIIKDGAVHFQNFEAKPPVDLQIRALNVVATNLTNSRKLAKSLVASIKGQAMAMQDGFIAFDLQIDPYKKMPTFQLDFKLENLQIAQLNDFFLYYAGMNMQRGKINVYMESAAKDGRITGYVKPIITDLKIIGDPKQQLTFGQKVKEFFAGLAAAILKNQKKQTVATRIEFEGDFNDPNVSVWSVLRQALRHAFVKALLPTIENRVSLKTVDALEKEKPRTPAR